MHDFLVAIIERNLAEYQFRNASFVAERLYASSKNEVTANYLARCYFHEGKYSNVVSLLKSKNSSDNRYLYAKSCYELKKFVDGEHALLRGTQFMNLLPDRLLMEVNRSNFNQIPHGCSGLYLLGQFSLKTQQKNHAIAYFKLALKFDCYLFDAFEQLCKLGANDDASSISGLGFAHSPDNEETRNFLTASLKSRRRGSINSMIDSDSRYYNNDDAASSSGSISGGGGSNSSIRTRENSLIEGEEDHQKIHSEVPSFLPEPHKYMDTYNKRRTSSRLAKQQQSSVLSSTTNKKQRVPSQKNYNQPSSTSATTTTKRLKSSLENSSKSNFSKTTATVPSHYNTNTNYNDIENQQNIVTDLFNQFGLGFWHLSYYRCKAALSAFQNISNSQFNCGWIHHQIGKAHFETGSYQAAKESFDTMRQVEPYRMEGLEIYSAVLWKLKLKENLAYLSQDCVEHNRLSEETWCVVGQSFSLIKDHDAAIKFFQRAIQLNPSFTYAYTLLGLEYYENDQFDKAAASFRHAIRIDDRHYNAWSGLALVYFREEKFNISEYHFKYALKINPHSNIIRTFLGQVQHRRQDYEAAIETFDTVISATSTSANSISVEDAPARFHRAQVLHEIDRDDEAYEELKDILTKCPNEAAAYVLMGKILKKQNKLNEAFSYYNAALALDLGPKVSGDVKNAMDKLNSNNEMEEEDCF